MGKIFSKPVSSVAPAQHASENRNASVMLVEPSMESDPPTEATLNQQVADSRRNILLDSIEPRGPASRHYLEGMPSNSPFSEHEQDATTWGGWGDSPVSPKVEIKGASSTDS